MVPDSAWARRKFREKDMTIRRLLAYRKVRELQWQLKLERERESWKQLETIGNRHCKLSFCGRNRQSMRAALTWDDPERANAAAGWQCG